MKEEVYGPTFDKWVSTKLMTLSTKCCKRNGDGLDIRPYCKVKDNTSPTCILNLPTKNVCQFFSNHFTCPFPTTIPGGELKVSAFVSGIVFYKNVSHKDMARSPIKKWWYWLHKGRAYNSISEYTIGTAGAVFANPRWKYHKSEARYFNGISCSESKGSGAIALNKHYPITTSESLFWWIQYHSKQEQHFCPAPTTWWWAANLFGKV